jgi:phosphoribosylformimino-5-aminoimidazole carboxamide ribotide isomerase
VEVIPAIDVLDGAAVRLRRGDYGALTVYDLDPIEVAVRWMRGGADLVHVVDLDAAMGGPRDRSLLEGLSLAGIAFQIGGGVRVADDARDLIMCGASRVVVGSAVVSSPPDAAEILDTVGPDRVVAALDVRDGRARGAGWMDSGVPLADAVATVLEVGITRVLVTGIDRDGMLDGPDVELLDDVRSMAPGLAIIASGGVGSLEDLRALSGAPSAPESVIVGKALYEGRFSLQEAIEVAG